MQHRGAPPSVTPATPVAADSATDAGTCNADGVVATGDAVLASVVDDAELVDERAAAATSEVRRDGVEDMGVHRGEPPLLKPLASPYGKSPLPHPGHTLTGQLVAPQETRGAPTLAEKRLEVVRRADERVQRGAARIVGYAVDAARLDDEGLPVDGSEIDARGKPVGWSGVRYNVAKDARKPLKQQPGYLAMMSRVHESYKKAEAGRGPAPELGAEIVVYVQQNTTYNYVTRDVSDPEREK